MKKLSILIPLLFCFITSLCLVLSSCQKMDDIQRKFTSRAETIYLGKADSLQSFPGNGRAKLTWYLSADPKIEQTIIYWNLHRDSIVMDVTRDSSSLQKDSIIIDSLPEGSSLFEFKNVNKEGETSLYSTVTVTVWGPSFADGLNGKIIQDFAYNYEHSIYNLTLSPPSENDNLLYSQLEYTDSHGEKKQLTIDRDSVNIELDNFPTQDSLRFRNVFFLPTGIDTLYSKYKTFVAPTAVLDRGTKISLQGTVENEYSSRGDSSLYEWNTNGDLNVYGIDDNGALVETETLPSIVPRSDFKFFFFYDDDKFIAISTGNGVEMKMIDGNQLVPVKTPGGQDVFGAGFNFSSFIPATGFFYSLTAGSGDIKTWFAKDNATWGSPNGTLVGTGYADYSLLALANNRQTLLAVDSVGHLWSMPISANGRIGSKTSIGIGWNRFKKIVSVGTKLLCMDDTGDFYEFANFDPNGSKFWVVN